MKEKPDDLGYKLAKDENKNIETSLWLSNQFPLKIDALLTVIKTLSLGGQSSLGKMKEFLKNDSLKQVISDNGFPVKIQIPIGYSVRATVTFNKFQYLENSPEILKEVFTVPEDCQYLNRREGMKTLKNKKKRMAMANLAI